MGGTEPTWEVRKLDYVNLKFYKICDEKKTDRVKHSNTNWEAWKNNNENKMGSLKLKKNQQHKKSKKINKMYIWRCLNERIRKMKWNEDA